jgi:hypothetical protein
LQLLQQLLRQYCRLVQKNIFMGPHSYDWANYVWVNAIIEDFLFFKLTQSIRNIKELVQLKKSNKVIYFVYILIDKQDCYNLLLFRITIFNKKYQINRRKHRKN